jgi:hypothetical protein
MEPIAVDFSLRGEWMATTTPGYKVPSHGTDLLAQTYAMDGLSIEHAKGLPCCFREYEVFEEGVWRKVINGIPTRYERIRVI